MKDEVNAMNTLRKHYLCSVSNNTTCYLIVTLSIVVISGCCLGACATIWGAKHEPVTVGQIVAMSRNGTHPDEIIAQIKKSGTVYRLKASQLAEIKAQGVSDEVIDYMQETYLDAVRRNQALEDWSYWRMYGDYWYGGIPYGWVYEGETIVVPYGSEYPRRTEPFIDGRSSEHEKSSHTEPRRR
jgi:hypothetical protein